jgi:ABC-type lipoprotein release transport system permease subunit
VGTILGCTLGLTCSFSIDRLQKETAAVELS